MQIKILRRILIKFMRQIVKQVKERYKIDLRCKSVKYHIWRLEDSEYSQLHKSSLPIVDYDFGWNYFQSRIYKQSRELNLAELFTILEWLLGETSNWYDEWKGSFSFPTLLVISKENGTFFYLMEIYDFRGLPQFKFYKILENIPKETNRYISHQPFESEFSEEEIKYFSNFFYGYLLGYFESIISIIPKNTFVRTIDSNSILYGCKDNEYFEEDCDSTEEYEATLKSFRETYGVVVNKKSINDILEKITTIS